MREAKEFCRDCPVIIQCLETAIENDEEYGIWAGLTNAQRKAIARFRNQVNDVVTPKRVVARRGFSFS